MWVDDGTRKGAAEMTIRGYRYRIIRWSNDTFDDPMPLRWIKNRVFYATAHWMERHATIRT